MSAPDPCRFCKLYARLVPLLAALIAAGTSLPYFLDQVSYGREPLLLFRVLRSTAPMASGTALLLALTLWAHPLSQAALQADLKRILRRAAMVAGPGYLLASAVALAACFGMSVLILGQSWAGFRGWLAVVGWQDLAVGAAATLLDTALIAFLTWRYAPKLRAARLSLPVTLIVVLTVTVPLRATVALIFSTFAPG